MYPSSPDEGPADEVDAAARREFFGPGDRHSGDRSPVAGEPTPAPARGDAIATPPVPDPITDHPLSMQTMDESAYRADPPTGVSRAARGRDEDLIDHAGYDGDAPEQKHRHDEDPYPGRYAANE